MALIAKETLRLGFTVVALPGNVVSPELVEEQGWQDLVEEDKAGQAVPRPAAGRKARKAAEE